MTSRAERCSQYLSWWIQNPGNTRKEAAVKSLMPGWGSFPQLRSSVWFCFPPFYVDYFKTGLESNALLSHSNMCACFCSPFTPCHARLVPKGSSQIVPFPPSCYLYSLSLFSPTPFLKTPLSPPIVSFLVEITSTPPHTQTFIKIKTRDTFKREEALCLSKSGLLYVI